MKQIGSVITGQTYLGQKGENSIGKLPGEPGLPAQSTGQSLEKSRPQSVQHPAIIERQPSQNMEAAVSRLQDFGLSLKQEVTGSRFPKGGGWEPIVEIKFGNDPDCDWSGVQETLNSLMAPAPVEKLNEWLTELAVLTASKDEGEAISALRLKILAERLQAFPGDVVRQTLSEWPEYNKWFPTAYVDLKNAIMARMGNRGRIAMRLRTAIKRQSTEGLSDGIDEYKQLRHEMDMTRRKMAIMGVSEKKESKND